MKGGVSFLTFFKTSISPFLLGLILLFPIYTKGQPYPVGYATFITPLQGANVRLLFSTIDDLKNGKTLSYSTVIGVSLVNPEGPDPADGFQAFAVYAVTPDAAISSLDGTVNIPLDRLQISASNFGASTLNEALIAPMAFEFYTSPVTLLGPNVQAEIFRSDRCRVSPISAQNAQIEINYEIGLPPNTINAFPAGIYTLELQFRVCAVDLVTPLGDCN